MLAFSSWLFFQSKTSSTFRQQIFSHDSYFYLLGLRFSSIAWKSKSEKVKIKKFWISHQSFVAKRQKNEGGPFRGEIFFEKSPKKSKGGPFVLLRYCILRGKPFWFSSLGQQVHFSAFWKFSRTFVRTILVSSGGLKNTLTKSNDHSRLFSRKAPTINQSRGPERFTRLLSRKRFVLACATIHSKLLFHFHQFLLYQLKLTQPDCKDSF